MNKQSVPVHILTANVRLAIEELHATNVCIAWKLVIWFSLFCGRLFHMHKTRCLSRYGSVWNREIFLLSTSIWRYVLGERLSLRKLIWDRFSLFSSRFCQLSRGSELQSFHQSMWQNVSVHVNTANHTREKNNPYLLLSQTRNGVFFFDFSMIKR